MHFLDVAIIFLFIIYAIWSGMSSRKVASQNLDEYFLAGRTLPGWKSGVSMAATQFAADTPLVVTGLIATAGIFAVWRLWIYALAFLLMGYVLAASWRRAMVLTDAELTEFRYSQRPAAALRAFKAVYLGTIFNCVVLAMVLLAASRIAEPFLLWNEWLPDWLFGPLRGAVESLGIQVTANPEADPQFIKSTNNIISILAIVTVTAFYSTTGGLRSVVNTDVMQFAIMMLATAIFMFWIVAEVGGFGALRDKLDALLTAQPEVGLSIDQMLAYEPSQAKFAATAIFVVFALQWFFQINADGTGYLAQRSMACRTDGDAKRAALVFTVAQVLVRSLLWIPLALALFLLFPPVAGEAVVQAEREQTYVTGMTLLPVGLKGLMLTAMLAALASTVDTHLNWGSSYWTNDVYKRFVCQSWQKREPSGRELVWVARLANVLILLIALVIMTQLTSIKDAWEQSLLIGAGVGPMLVLRWLWWRVNAWGEITTLVTSMILLPVLFNAVVDDPSTNADDTYVNAVRLLLMGVIATGAGIAACYIAGPGDQDKLRQFYERVRPMGFWGPVAQAAGDNPQENRRRLGLGLLAVGLTAFSIFCVLTGLGSWMVGSPPPTWLPSRLAWIVGLLVLGVGLIPVWWRVGFVALRLPPSATDAKG